MDIYNNAKMQKCCHNIVKREHDMSMLEAKSIDIFSKM